MRRFLVQLDAFVALCFVLLYSFAFGSSEGLGKKACLG